MSLTHANVSHGHDRSYGHHRKRGKNCQLPTRCQARRRHVPVSGLRWRLRASGPGPRPTWHRGWVSCARAVVTRTARQPARLAHQQPVDQEGHVEGEASLQLTAQRRERRRRRTRDPGDGQVRVGCRPCTGRVTGEALQRRRCREGLATIDSGATHGSGYRCPPAARGRGRCAVSGSVTASATGPRSYAV